MVREPALARSAHLCSGVPTRAGNGFAGGSADGSRILASSPFIEANTGLPTAVLISAPGVAAGTTRVVHATGPIWGFEILGRALLAGGGWRLDGFAGYRYRGFDESLEIYKDIRPLGPAFVPGTTIQCNDYFRTRNQFHGAAFGLDWQTEVCGCLLAVRPSVGIGQMETRVERSGINVIDVPGDPRLCPGERRRPSDPMVTESDG